jgi:hypothetical protein
MPYIIIAFLSFNSLGFESFEPYAILLSSFFTGHFHFKAGYAVAYCESNNIPLDD